MARSNSRKGSSKAKPQGGGRARAGRSALARVARVPAPPPRKRDSHKGDFGRVLVIGGSRGMIGAAALAANAALRSGAGLVTVACPESIQLAVATLCPCATSIPLPEDHDGRLRPSAAARILSDRGLLREGGGIDVVAAGPGLGAADERYRREWVELLRLICAEAKRPLVLDADGLNALPALAESAGAQALADAGLFRAVLTPHPGEMARLLGETIVQVQAHRTGVAARAAELVAEQSGGRDERMVVLLKGAGTVVTDGRRVHINRTGNAGMATGGTGDVLTGVIASLIGQGMNRFEAAVLGAHVHGLAGDLAAKELGQMGMIASDLLEYLPKAFLQLSRR